MFNINSSHFIHDQQVTKQHESIDNVLNSYALMRKIYQDLTPDELNACLYVNKTWAVNVIYFRVSGGIKERFSTLKEKLKCFSFQTLKSKDELYPLTSQLDEIQKNLLSIAKKIKNNCKKENVIHVIKQIVNLYKKAAQEIKRENVRILLIDNQPLIAHKIALQEKDKNIASQLMFAIFHYYVNLKKEDSSQAKNYLEVNKKGLKQFLCTCLALLNYSTFRKNFYGIVPQEFEGDDVTKLEERN